MLNKKRTPQNVSPSLFCLLAMTTSVSLLTEAACRLGDLCGQLQPNYERDCMLDLRSALLGGSKEQASKLNFNISQALSRSHVEKSLREAEVRLASLNELVHTFSTSSGRIDYVFQLENTDKIALPSCLESTRSSDLLSAPTCNLSSISSSRETAVTLAPAEEECSISSLLSQDALLSIYSEIGRVSVLVPDIATPGSIALCAPPHLILPRIFIRGKIEAMRFVSSTEVVKVDSHTSIQPAKSDPASYSDVLNHNDGSDESDSVRDVIDLVLRLESDMPFSVHDAFGCCVDPCQDKPGKQTCGEEKSAFQCRKRPHPEDSHREANPFCGLPHKQQLRQHSIRLPLSPSRHDGLAPNEQASTSESIGAAIPSYPQPPLAAKLSSHPALLHLVGLRIPVQLPRATPYGNVHTSEISSSTRAISINVVVN